MSVSVIDHIPPSTEYATTTTPPSRIAHDRSSGKRTEKIAAYAEVEDPLYLAEKDNRYLTFSRAVRLLGAVRGRRLLDVGAYCGIFADVAQRAGFGTAALLRHHFTRQLGIAPSAYRRRFACVEPSAMAEAAPAT